VSKRKKVGEGLYLTKGDTPVGPHHRRIARVLDKLVLLGSPLMAHVELECGHTVVLLNKLEQIMERGTIHCGECEDAASTLGEPPEDDGRGRDR
jgi:hypothetical protein